VLAVLLALGAGGISRAQDAASTLFASDEPLRFRLEAPFTAVNRDRKDPENHSARLVYSDGSGTEVGIDLAVRVRGKSRAQVCAFPPLLLNFPSKALAGTLFEGQNKLKLVTHCQPESTYEQYLWIEYLAYQVLSRLTDTSLRVRPVEVTYYDSQRGRAVTTKPGFLIEDEGQFAKRRGLTPVKDERIDRARYDAAALGLVEVFQFFIGNTDWSAAAGPAGSPCCHNVVPMARADGMLVPVPYDFDSSGIVNPPHALPAEGLPIRDVRTRLYRGPCRSVDELEASFEPFRRNRAAIESLFEGGRNLGRPGVEARRYIDDFYAVLGDPQRVERAFRFNCKR